MKNRKPQGQATVEFAFVLIIMLIIIAGMIDAAPLIGDWFIAKGVSARAARAAAVYLPDGVRSCRGDAINAAGEPLFISAEFTLDISPNCDWSPLSTMATGTPVWATVDVIYMPLFWGGFGWPPKDSISPWPFSVTTNDLVR